MRAVVCVLVAVLVITACQAMTTEANPTTGAIFTTTADGATVNGNIYTNKNDVYLNGGPQSGCSQAGLQDGIYYFQVRRLSSFFFFFFFFFVSAPSPPLQKHFPM